MKRSAHSITAILVLAGFLGVSCVHRESEGRTLSLMSLRPEEVDSILLKGMCISKVRKPGDPSESAIPQIIENPGEIAHFIGTLQRTKHLWRVPEELHDSGRADEIDVRLKKDPSNAAFVIYIDSDTVGRDYGAEMKKLYEKYRQRTWAEIERQ